MKPLRLGVGCAGLLLSLTACGSDSTGPSTLDSNAALQSLALGIAGDAGTSNFDYASNISTNVLPAIAVYLEG